MSAEPVIRRFLYRARFPLALIALIFLMRWGFWWGDTCGFFSSDDSIPLLMTRHIANGSGTPLFFYGQFYHGAALSWILAPIMKVLGFAPRILIISNILLFSMGTWFLAAFSGHRRRFLWYYLLPLPSLLLVSVDTSVHFALVFCLSAFVLLLVFRMGSHPSHSHLVLFGASAGLLFWVYQGSLLITVPLGVVIVYRLLRRGVKGLIPLVIAGFSALAGMVPLLISELKSGFSTLSFTLSGSHSLPGVPELIEWIWRFLKLNGYSHFALRDPSLGFPQGLTLLLALITLAGLSSLVVRARRERSLRWLLWVIPASLFIVAGSKFGGMITANPAQALRYQLHALALAPFALILLAEGLMGIDTLLRRALNRKSKFPLSALAVFLLLIPFMFRINGYAKNEGAAMTRLAGELKSSEQPRLYFGEYIRYFRYNALTREKSMVIPTPLLFSDQPFFTNLRYYPYALSAFTRWKSESFGLLLPSGEGAPLASRLRRLFPDLRLSCRHLSRDDLLIFPPETPLDLLSPRFIRNLGKVPAQPPVSAVETTSSALKLSFSATARPTPYSRVRLKSENTVIDIPVIAADPVFNTRIPVPPGRYEIIYRNLLPVQGPKSAAIDIQGPEPKRIVMNRYRDPCDLVYFCVSRKKAMSARGIPVNSGLEVTVPAPNARALELEIVNPFTFESRIWPLRFRQEILLGGGRPPIFLKNGLNLVKIPIQPGETLRLTPRFNSFFKSSDSAMRTRILPMGFLISRIRLRLSNGTGVDVTPLLSNGFLETHRNRVRARFRKR